jgi:FAD/FMN-containing dehydrogenase/Fe-S oxidoreductase
MRRSATVAFMSDLRAALVERGVTEIDDSARRRSEYASDASLYRITPQAVVFPRSVDEVMASLDACRSLGVPVTGRGAGTSIAGNAVGRGLVIDYSRHLNKVLSIDAEAATARIQPGIVLAALQAAAAPYDLRFGPDPSTHNRATLGGMIGNNACGSRALAYGRTSDNVHSADVLFGNGERATLTNDASCLETSSTASRLATLVSRNLATVRTSCGRFPRQGSGYSLEHLLPERMSPVQAYVGTEGTWGQLLEATVRLVPRPTATALLVVGYPSMADAADAAPGLVPFGPVAIEGLDSRIVDIVVATHGPSAVPPLPRGAGWLMVEVPGTTLAEAQTTAERMAAGAGGIDHLVLTNAAQAAAVWRIREDGAGLVSRPRDGHFALAGFEDAAVPPAVLGRYLRDFDALLDQYSLHGVPYGHFGDGCVHVRIDFELSTGDGRARFAAFLDEAAALVAGYGGSISGEHGDGRARSSLLPSMYSPEVLSLFADAKQVVDPDALCNPGVIVDPAPVTADLRLARPTAVHTPLALAYPHDAERFDFAVARCTGVGKCRADTSSTGGVMCPSYLATKDEKDSTRGRARVLQDMIAGDLPGGWRSDAVQESLDLCLACKGCTSECPTGIDMPTYKAEALYQRYRHRIRPRTHYTLGRIPQLLRLVGGRGVATKALNVLMRSPLSRAAGAVAGVDKARSLPSFAPRSFAAAAAGSGLRELGPGSSAPSVDPGRPARRPVAIWADTITNYLRPEVGDAMVTVLRSAGFDPVVVGGARGERVCCGLPQFSTGQLDIARASVTRTAALLEPLLAQGIPVVGMEPSCVSMMRSDAAHLIGRTVDVRTLGEFLEQYRPDWVVPDLTGVEIVVQPHCHHRAVMDFAADERLLRRAGATVTTIAGCCGLAGDFGMTAGKAGVSKAVAEVSLLPALRVRPEGSIVLADGYSCQLQCDDLAGVKALALPELLAQRIGARDRVS